MNETDDARAKATAGQGAPGLPDAPAPRVPFP